MADGSKIEWCDATFNPWIGCTRISAACDFCYAERWGARFGVEWGNHPRRRTSASYWRQPLKWDAQAKAAGIRKRVFCASLADWLDNQVAPAWRADLGELVVATPNLDWLLLSKRPQNYEKLAPWPVDHPPPNVWLGTTAENQDEWDRRVEQIGRFPAAVHFVSVEPMLSDIDCGNAFDGPPEGSPYHAIGWVIVGGESGPGARPMHPDWARSLRDQCAGASVPFFFKQWGEYAPQQPVYWEEDKIAADLFVKKHYGPDERVGDWDLSAADAIDWMKDFPDLGVLYRDGHFYDGAEWQPHVRSGCWWMERVGKKAAGHLLDGREHREFPEARDD